MLKQELKVESQKLKQRQVVEERRRVNRIFKSAPKNVYRSVKGEGNKPVKEMPDQGKLEKFWGELWVTLTEFNLEAPWLKTLEQGYASQCSTN